MSTHRVSLDLNAMLAPPQVCRVCGGLLLGCGEDRSATWCPQCRATGGKDPTSQSDAALPLPPDETGWPR
jgi:hypothetical protein